jgi:hypothetical protein
MPGPGAPHPIPGSALATPESPITDSAAIAVMTTKAIAVLRNTLIRVLHSSRDVRVVEHNNDRAAKAVWTA